MARGSVPVWFWFLAVDSKLVLDQRPFPSTWSRSALDLSAMDFEGGFRHLVPRCLGRPWRVEDGLPSTAIASVERKLQCVLPAAVRAFYCNLGGLDALCAVPQQIRAPNALAFEEGPLVVHGRESGRRELGCAP